MSENLFSLLKNGDIEQFNSEIADFSEDLTESDFSGIEAEGANFKEHDLSGSDFSETMLDSANFDGCDLSSATFARAELRGVSFSGAILNGTKFNNSTIYACDFTDADLSGADFSEADLSDSDLSLSLNMNQCAFNKYTVWPDSDKLPSDFESDYQEDLASLNDDESEGNQDY